MENQQLWVLIEYNGDYEECNHDANTIGIYIQKSLAVTTLIKLISQDLSHPVDNLTQKLSKILIDNGSNTHLTHRNIDECLCECSSDDSNECDYKCECPALVRYRNYNITKHTLDN